MTAKTGCALSILVARPDVGYMMHTIPHLVRACRYPFTERVLVVDLAPLPARYESNPSVGPAETLLENCQKLVDAGVMDRVWRVDYSDACRRQTYAKHLTKTISDTRDWRGYPNLGTMAAIDLTDAAYFLHFDSDMLLYQEPGHDWIAAGMELLDGAPEVMFAAPLPGPPTADGNLQQRDFKYRYDARGFYEISFFTSRKYLLQREKFARLLPLKPLYVSDKRRLLGLVTGRSASSSWEMMISRALGEKGFTRADLSSGKSWTLHTPDHGAAFLKALPGIIERVEQGWFPPSQAGDYDLQLERWLA